MRSKDRFYVIRYCKDGSIVFLCNNGKWTKNNKLDKAKTFALSTKLWNNSGNAWRCIAKLIRNIPFKELFVMSPNGLTPFTEDDSMAFSNLLSVTTDQGVIDAIALEAYNEKYIQIGDLQETLASDCNHQGK